MTPEQQALVAFVADRYRTVRLSYEAHIARERPRTDRRDLEKYDEKTARLAGQVFILRTLVTQIERGDYVLFGLRLPSPLGEGTEL